MLLTRNMCQNLELFKEIILETGNADFRKSFSMKETTRAFVYRDCLVIWAQ